MTITWMLVMLLGVPALLAVSHEVLVFIFWRHAQKARKKNFIRLP